MIRLNGRMVCEQCKVRYPCLAANAELYTRIYGPDEDHTGYDLP